MFEPQSLPRNTLTLLVSNGGGALLSFTLSVLIGRVLGEDGLGVYATALAWVFPLSLVADFGLGTLITRDVAQHEAAGNSYLRATTAARLLLGGGLLLALWLLAPLVSREIDLLDGIRVSAPLVVILPLFGAFTAVFRARRVMWPIPWLNLGMLAFQVPLTALVFAGGGGAVAALAVNTATSAGQLVAAWFIHRRWFYQPSRLQVNSLHMKTLLKRAWPFALAAVLAALQVRISVILLEQIAGAGQAGYFAAASRFVDAGRLLPNARFGALLPALAASAADPSGLRGQFRRMSVVLAVYGAAFGLVISLLAVPVVELTYGSRFEAAVPVLQIAAWSLLPALLRSGRVLYWYAAGREQFVNAVTGVVLVLQIALSLWLIPTLGAEGVALVMLAVEMAAVLLLWMPLPFDGMTTRNYESLDAHSPAAD